MKRLFLGLLLIVGWLATTTSSSAYYDPETGTFLTRDPAGMIDGPNEYTYVQQNPWTHFDPEGLNSDADQKQVAADLAGTDIGPAILAQEHANNQAVQVGVTVAKTIQTAAELTPMQNAATALTGKDAVGNKVSGTQQAMAVAGVILPELKGAATVVKDTAKVAEDVNAANKMASAGVKAETSAKDTVQATSDIRQVSVDAQKYPETAQHIEEAQAAGQPSVLTIDRTGADANRKAAMQGQAKVAGKDRDEYPPAVFTEGGSGASVKPISPSDNRGAGSSMMHQTKDLPNGAQVQVKVTNDNK